MLRQCRDQTHKPLWISSLVRLRSRVRISAAAPKINGLQELPRLGRTHYAHQKTAAMPDTPTVTVTLTGTEALALAKVAELGITTAEAFNLIQATGSAKRALRAIQDAAARRRGKGNDGWAND